MKYVVTQDVTYHDDATGKTIKLPRGTAVESVAFADLDHRDQRALKGIARRQDTRQHGSRIVAFMWRDKLRTAVIGEDLKVQLTNLKKTVSRDTL